MSQCVPGAMTPFHVPLAIQLLSAIANGPVLVMLLTDTPTEPALMIWTSCCTLVVPTVNEPKERLFGETETGVEAALDTVMVTPTEVVLLPAASRATAARVCSPLEAVAVFHERV